MADFTEGPWRINPFEVVNGDSNRVIMGNDDFMVATCEGRPVQENDANAQLIAAAPDGYALAEEVLNHLYTTQDIGRVRAMAKEFIAKADGKSHA